MKQKHKVCSCYLDYPNERQKHRNGKWKCIDEYECVIKHQFVENRTSGKHEIKTVCVEKRLFEIEKAEETV